MGDLMQMFEDKKSQFDAWVKEQPPAVRAVTAAPKIPKTCSAPADAHPTVREPPPRRTRPPRASPMLTRPPRARSVTPRSRWPSPPPVALSKVRAITAPRPADIWIAASANARRETRDGAEPEIEKTRLDSGET